MKIKKNSLKEMLKEKKLLIFDFDGTIADTSPFHELAFIETLKPLKVKVDYQLIAGQKTIDAMKLCCKKLKLDDSQYIKLTKTKQKKFREKIGKAIKPLPGVHEFIEWAQSSYDLAIASSGSRSNIIFCLEKLGYLNFFQYILCADDVKNGKPNPEIFLKVLKKFHYQPEDALIFEDSQAGFEASVNAGIEYFDANSNLWISFMKESK
jgi:HAD superfamily hydrolase (TIGR01509 family)